MRRNILLLLVLVTVGLFSSGCATYQLDDGPYLNQGSNKTLQGAAIGAGVGYALGGKTGAIVGGLIGGAGGSYLGNPEDRQSFAASRAYRENVRQEWKEVVAMYQKDSDGKGTTSFSKVIVVGSSRRYSRGWQYSVLVNVEQGLRQKGFIVVQPSNDRYRSKRVGASYNAYDADLIAEIILQDLRSSAKVTINLRSLTGKNALDRQGIGQVRYRRSRSNRGPSKQELRDRAFAGAVKLAIENLLTYSYFSAQK